MSWFLGWSRSRTFWSAPTNIYSSLNNNSCSYNNFTRKRPYLHSNLEFLKPLIYKVNDLFFKCCTIPSGAGAERQSRSWATEMQLDAAIERQSRCRSRPVVLYVSGTRFLHWRVQNLIKFCFCRYRYLTNTSRITFQQKKSHKWTVKCIWSPLMFFFCLQNNTSLIEKSSLFSVFLVHFLFAMDRSETSQSALYRTALSHRK